MEVDWSTFWSAISGIATSIGAVAIWFMRKQLRFEAWLKAQEIWTIPDFIQSRGFVFAKLDNESVKWNADEENKALDVCRKMDEFARLIPYLPKHTAISIWGIPFAKAWVILEPIVKKERDKCSWSDKWSAFEQLGKASLKRYPKMKRKK
jgi:hypothetical protein